MADKKGKTKAAILQELESIKGLLLEEDAPVLQQPENHDQVYSDRPLPKHDLKKLHHEFQALNEAISSTTTDINAELYENYDEDVAADLDYPSRSDHPTQKTAPLPDTQYQASLFQNPSNNQLIQQTGAKAALQKNRAVDPLNYAVKKSITPAPSNRPTIIKASGENPFLPQHIRERLQGNNPFPSFELNEMVPAYKSEQYPHKNETAPIYKNEISSAPKITTSPTLPDKNDKSVPQTDAQVSRHSLIHEVIDTVMPEIERELRQRLESMTEDQLLELLSAH